MYLKELTINGFKSFAKKGELEFSTPITAIVGPNGSGKSNVAEAFRFVLGEQSIKSMRGKRGEDLIFNGSESTSRANRASVTIMLDNQPRNGTRVFPLDFDEITVERVVHRDGTNEYSINGSRTRLKDVQELLASANIGPSGHHIISQGEADRILSASPKERREMIEDALGLKVYQFKKAESERKLAKTLENIAQVESLRKEVAPHLKFLERQVKKLEKALELQGALKEFYAEYLRREDSYIAFHHDRLMAEREAPEKRKAELEEALKEAKEKLEREGEKDEKRDALVELEEAISAARKKKQEAVHAVGQLEGQIAFLSRRIEERERAEKHEDEAPIPYKAVSETQESIKKKIDAVLESDDVSDLKKVLRQVLEVFEKLLSGAHAPQRNSTLESEKHELEELEKEKKEAEKHVESVSKQEDELEKEYGELKSSIESEASVSREAERLMFTIMNEQREIEQTLGTITRELQSLERDRNEFKRELQEAVSLLGRDAASYFDHVVKTDGGEVTREQIVKEDREKQHERRRELEKMKIRLEELGTGSNEDIVKEYNDVKERDEFLVHEITDLTASVEKLEALILDLTNQLNEQFITGLEKIGAEFEHFFTLMFGGGKAALLRIKPKKRRKKDDDLTGLEDEMPEEEAEEETEEGIEIDVKLPNKRVKGLEMLSGGERALTSIALIFAMSQVNPPLFVILDETDAALDEANSKRYGDMITALSERSQLILITHNRETMGRAGVLYGVTMGADGVSKLLSVKFDEAVAVAK